MSGSITVVGLGSGDESQLTLGVWTALQQASEVYMRTDRHPVCGWLKENGIDFRSFDDIYEDCSSFDEVYETIVSRLLEAAQTSGEGIVYAVPGHPSVAEKTTLLLKHRCPEAGIRLRVASGESFLDQAFLRFGFDPIEGFQLLDAGGLTRELLNPRLHTVVGQVYDTLTASDVKLTLMDVYPDDYPVVIGHELGIGDRERIVSVPLFELDRVEGFGNLSLVWIPRTDEDRVLGRSFDRLHEIIRILRSPEGCPWDREQTHASIRKNLIEETYEVLETIDDDDLDAMCEELGDLMLQIMLHSQMEEETGMFTVYDVIEELNEKLVRRHPHVFGTQEADNADEALVNWEAVKAEEKRSKGVDPERLSVLAGVPRDLPALMKAYKLQKKAASVGFDWDRIEDVVAKIEEELGEVKVEIGLAVAQEGVHHSTASTQSSIERQKDELGDLLFAVVNLARFLKIDPEEALSGTNRKFFKRFGHIEESLRLKGKTFDQTSLLEMETYWQEAKKL